ncbi:MAG: AMP-binding protein [Propionibacteriaceae bacterium]|jgi:long-chain acyl-CoA synthetase|nr:AMP-binding protein [Propionibacteriaceae bacterium]
MTTSRPWLKVYSELGIDDDFHVPDATMYQMLAQAGATWPDKSAFFYLGKRMTYQDLLSEVDACAAAFVAMGIGARDSVVLSLPNVPAVVICFYALNKIGARAVMTHPLSSPTELKHYIGVSESQWAVTMDMFYPVFRDLADQSGLKKIVIAKFSDYLSKTMKLGFAVTKGRKIPSVPGKDSRVLMWKDFLAQGETGESTRRWRWGGHGDEAQGAGEAGSPSGEGYQRPITPDETAVILFSGGTTNLPKGIELSSANFNALAVSMKKITGLQVQDSILAILPAFHGFGLGLCIHTPVCLGAYFILVPEFSTEIYINNLIKYEPSFIAGVPTLYQALMSNPKFEKVRFDKLKGAYSGGDMLSADLKARFDQMIINQGSQTELIEGYGLTECVTACVVSPRLHYRDNSMGIPIPGMDVKVALSATGEEVPYGQEGEICITGPTLMQGYIQDPEATAHTLRVHADGRTWLHSGDIGTMDEDGYLYFMGRMKRIIKVSGVSVYPMQVEQVLEAHPLVSRACVIGLPDEYQMSSVKAFVLLADGSTGSDAQRAELIAYCKKHLIKWAVPRQIEFRTELPTTRVGKIAYTELEHEEAAKLAG